MKKHFIYCFSLFLFTLGILFSCTEESFLNLSEEENLESSITRAAFDGYFDWDRVSAIPTKNSSGNDITISLPWEQGSTQNIGIPESWLDSRAYNVPTSERFYSREKGWELVYSNMHQNTPSKYFALYNKYTGLLRFFFYEIASSGGYGTSVSFWGIALDNSSTLFNFTNSFMANGANVPIYQPSVITTPEGSFSTAGTSGVGYKSNNWYGIEIECAYDSNISTNKQLNFKIKGWAANKITLSGTGTTSGSITGTIKTTIPNSSGFNLSLSNMFNSNNNSSSVIANNSNISGSIGKKIDEEIGKGDPFFKTLWNNVKNNASKWISSGLQAGAEKGISAILSSGGSVVGEALGGLVNSLIGGKKKESISKVDLSLSTLTKIQLEGETTLVGWGNISSFPVPGSTSNPYNMPLYNKPLGVWNLKETPKVTADLYTATTWLPIGSYCQYNLRVNKPEIVLNPEIASKFNINITSYNLVTYGYGVREYGISGTPYAVINGNKFYNVWYAAKSKIFHAEVANFNFAKQISKYIQCRVSFDLIDKNDSNNIYSFSRYFNVDCIQGSTYHRNDVYPEGNGDIIPFPF